MKPEISLDGPANRRLRSWWMDDPADPGRLSLTSPCAQALIREMSPASRPTDLGGVMSLNVHLDALGSVLRIHQPFVSHARLLGLHGVRATLSKRGLRVPGSRAWQGRALLRCGRRWAELEEYIPHRRLKPTMASYQWLFGALGRLHRALHKVDLRVPRPCVATYAAPSSLHRWLGVTARAVEASPECAPLIDQLRTLIRGLDRLWVPASQLPVQFIHGDARLSNIVQTTAEETLYLDFGFLAQRPRVFDIAYALVFMAWALQAGQSPEQVDWAVMPDLLDRYEESSGFRLSRLERRALLPMMVSVPLYAAALDGFTEDPAGRLLGRTSFIAFGAWLRAHPEIVSSVCEDRIVPARRRSPSRACSPG